MWHNSSACHAYVMWADHIHFLYVTAISNVVTNGNICGIYIWCVFVRVCLHDGVCMSDGVYL